MITDYNKTFEEIMRLGLFKWEEEESLLHKERFKKIIEYLDEKDRSKISSPSYSSLIMLNSKGFKELIGNCSRSTWFKKNGAVETNPNDEVSLFRMKIGKKVEEIEQDYAVKAMEKINEDEEQDVEIRIFKNIMIGYHIQSIDMFIVGEIDILMIIDNVPVPIEIKSYYGYKAKKEIEGSAYELGSPKKNHAMQAFLYAYAFTPDNINTIHMWDSKGDPIDTESLNMEPNNIAIMRYIDRGDCNKTQFEMSLTPIIKAEDGSIKRSLFEELLEASMSNKNDIENDYEFVVNGDRFLEPASIKNLLNRHKKTLKYSNNPEILPPRDSTYQYDIERQKYMRNSNKLNKKQCSEFDSKGTTVVGDWQCRYCNWKDLCLGKTPWEKDTIPSDEEILITIEEIKNNEASDE